MRLLLEYGQHLVVPKETDNGHNCILSVDQNCLPQYIDQHLEATNTIIQRYWFYQFHERVVQQVAFLVHRQVMNKLIKDRCKKSQK